MSESPTSNDRELDHLIDRMCDQIASDDELAVLGRQLVEDPGVCDHYIACLELHAALAWQMMPGKAFTPSELHHYAKVDSPAADPAPQAPNPLISPPVVNLNPSPVSHTSLFSLDSPLGSFVFSYTVAAVLLGLGMLISSVIYVTHYSPQIAETGSELD